MVATRTLTGAEVTGDLSVQVGSTGLKEITAHPSPGSLSLVERLATSTSARLDLPLRKSFVRSDEAGREPPLARLVARGGRDGSVAVKLYLGLIWRCSAPPFTTDAGARTWAALLDLDDPNHRGARRVTEALNVLKEFNLVALTRRRGESSTITLLEESGRGREYELPGNAFVQADRDAKPEHIYFKVPTKLWTSGHLQGMSAAALAMLLITLAEATTPDQEVWWSTEVFPPRYALSPTMRARGTKELVRRRLLLVTKQQVLTSPGRTNPFARERVRNIYRLINEAKPPPRTAPDDPTPIEPRKRATKTPRPR